MRSRLAPLVVFMLATTTTASAAAATASAASTPNQTRDRAATMTWRQNRPAPAVPARVSTAAAVPSNVTLTGAHWGAASDLSTFKHIGYEFDVATLNPGDPSSWAGILDAAQANGLKLIIGAYPEPYSYSGGEWSISAAGVNLLNYLASRSSLVLALFVYNEPYWLSPTTGAASSCGAMSAADLRGLRTKIQSVWPGAKIYHDLGEPSAWAPGGYLYNAYSCIGNKYADQTGVADYVGVWDYPFEAGGYHKASALSTLTRETNYVINSMHAVPVWLNQSHAASCCNLVFPTQAQLLDWNCSVRKALPVGSLISWYVWRQGIYSDTLSNHPEDWASTTLGACGCLDAASAGQTDWDADGAGDDCDRSARATLTNVGVRGHRVKLFGRGLPTLLRANAWHVIIKRRVCSSGVCRYRFLKELRGAVRVSNGKNRIIWNAPRRGRYRFRAVIRNSFYASPKSAYRGIRLP